jgi:protein-S-isoprenylcysteine O-methyltransferase Ste14
MGIRRIRLGGLGSRVLLRLSRRTFCAERKAALTGELRVPRFVALRQHSMGGILRMRLRNLVGAGDRIVALTLPFAVAGITTNVVWPDAFRMGFGLPGLIAGFVLLALGVPLWLWAAVQILAYVPRGRLITTGPFVLFLHPIYTSVALLVIPGCGLVMDTWVGFAIGGALYASSRFLAPSEERQLAEAFPAQYPAYRTRVVLPWL